MAREQLSSACPDELTRKGPVRTCIGCRERAAKRELLRVTVGSDANGHPVVVPDPGATAPGRGAHVHPTAECYQLAVRRKAFGRALRVPAGLPSASVEEYLGSRHQQDQHQQGQQGQDAKDRTRPTDRNRSSSS